MCVCVLTAVAPLKRPTGTRQSETLSVINDARSTADVQSHLQSDNVGRPSGDLDSRHM